MLTINSSKPKMMFDHESVLFRAQISHITYFMDLINNYVFNIINKIKNKNKIPIINQKKE